MTELELRENFQHFDKDGNGTIEFDEFSALLDVLGFDGDKAERKIGFEIIDGNNNGEISFEEFSAWWDGQ